MYAFRSFPTENLVAEPIIIQSDRALFKDERDLRQCSPRLQNQSSKNIGDVCVVGVPQPNKAEVKCDGHRHEERRHDHILCTTVAPAGPPAAIASSPRLCPNCKVLFHRMITLRAGLSYAAFPKFAVPVSLPGKLPYLISRTQHSLLLSSADLESSSLGKA